MGVGVGKDLPFAVNKAKMRLYDVSKAEGVAYQALQDKLKLTKTKTVYGKAA